MTTHDKSITKEVTDWLYAYNLDIPQKELNNLLKSAERELPRWISPHTKAIYEEIIEELERAKKEEPYPPEDFEQVEDGLSDSDIRNAVKMLKNMEGQDLRWGYNQALDDIFAKIKSKIKSL